MTKFFVVNKKKHYYFNEKDFSHLKVRRIKTNDLVFCFDITNNVEVELKIIQTNPYIGILNKIIKKIDYASYPITCFLAVIKKANFELAAEKLNELNIKRIVPFYSHYSQKNYQLDFSRLEKIIDNSNKQSNRLEGIEITKPIEFIELENSLKNYDNCFFAHIDKDLNPTIELDLKNQSIAYLIGPEGGFSKDEIDLLLKMKVNGLKLTSTILKSETAAIYLGSLLISKII